MLKLIRNKFTKNGIFGLLYIDGKEFFFTLEHSYNLMPKVPAGIYVCKRGMHQLQSGPIETFEVTGVPGHTGILLHYGNYNSDSDGCILLGYHESGDMIEASRFAFNRFLKCMDGINHFSLEIKDGL